MKRQKGLANPGLQLDELVKDWQTGYIPLPLSGWREIASNDYDTVATGAAKGSGGTLGKDSTPNLERINAATDKKTQLEWAAANVDEIACDFAYPPDLDDAQPIVFNMLAKMGGATDTPVVAVSYFEGVGDANAGGNTGAVTGTTVTKYTRTIAAADVGAYPNAASIGLVPAAHGTDTLVVLATWLEYTRK